MKKSQNTSTTNGTIFQSTELVEGSLGLRNNYYRELKVTPIVYKLMFDKDYPLKKNQKLITVRQYLAEAEAKTAIINGAKLIYKN